MDAVELVWVKTEMSVKGIGGWLIFFKALGRLKERERAGDCKDTYCSRSCGGSFRLCCSSCSLSFAHHDHDKAMILDIIL